MTAKEIIEDVSKHIGKINPESQNFFDDLCYLAENIDRYASSKWVSVDERLPEPGERVQRLQR